MASPLRAEAAAASAAQRGQAGRDLLFVSIVKASADYGQAQVLVLDDVFQSVDSTVRVKLMRFVLRQLKDWQVIFTVHDRLWMNQLLAVCRELGHDVLFKEIVRWDFDSGPVMRDARSDPGAELEAAIDSGANVPTLCALSGLLLEEVCDRLSPALPTSVTRRTGDRYTLGDLWPGVFKKLRKTSAHGAAESVNQVVTLRNLAGAHYNEWATSLSRQEAMEFAESVIQLYSLVYCNECAGWIQYAGNGAVEWRCRGKHVTLA
jgi:hypothetical protein